MFRVRLWATFFYRLIYFFVNIINIKKVLKNLNKCKQNFCKPKLKKDWILSILVSLIEDDLTDPIMIARVPNISSISFFFSFSLLNECFISKVCLNNGYRIYDSSIFGLNINITALSNESYIMATCTYFIIIIIIIIIKKLFIYLFDDSKMVFIFNPSESSSL